MTIDETTTEQTHTQQTPQPLTKEAFLQYLVEAEEAEELSQNDHELETKLNNCGQWASIVSPETGGHRAFQSFCNDYRRCPVCNEREAQILLDRVYRAENVWMGVIADKDWATATHRFNRNSTDYLSIPAVVTDSLAGDNVKRGLKNSDQPAHIVFCTDKRIKRKSDQRGPASEWDGDMLFDLLKSALKHMPDGMRKSGSLGRVSIPPPEDVETVAVEAITHDADKETRRAAWNAAVEETAYLCPTMGEEVEEACKTRMNAFKSQLVEKGAVITSSRWVKRYVRIASIDWSTIHANRTLGASKKTEINRTSFQNLLPKFSWARNRAA